MSEATARRRGIVGWLAGIEDGSILRAAFFGLLLGTGGVLYIDYTELTANDASAVLPGFDPVLPAFDPSSPEAPAGPEVTTDFERLKNPLTIALGSGGVLNVTGTIDPGSAERFATEVEARGEYIKTVAFDSPGGSVNDAIAIGDLIHARGFATSVAAGALCASSCPLAFAGGIERHATPASAIGVHQIYAGAQTGAAGLGINAGAEAMSSAQRTTAEITKHLSKMGVDPAIWIHALETPPASLYYLSPDELKSYRLVTTMDKPGTTSP